MFKSFSFAALTVSSLVAISASAPAFAQDGGQNIEYPVDRPNIAIKRSYLTDQVVVIPPYRHLFRVRVFTTPQRDPYYNVPPYAVISPR